MSTAAQAAMSTRAWMRCAVGGIVLFDTDIFIWIQRGNAKAARLVDAEGERSLSVYSYMELLQGARDATQHARTTGFLKSFGFRTLPLSGNIGHRAAVYIEEYALSHGLRAGDALIAATAVEHGEVLCTANRKHFGMIRELRLKILKP
jgi:predicted nucleic acid-binding protein